jgi:hypothetical protein
MMAKDGPTSPPQNPESGPVITVFHRDVYGSTRIYAADDKQAAALLALTGRLTLDRAGVGALRSLGVRVVFDQAADPRYADTA